MDIYIVVYETNEYYSESRHQTYSSENDALLQAIECASSTNFNFDKVLKINTNTKKIFEYELSVNAGKIKLQEK